MAHLQQTIKAIIRPGEHTGYVAECMEIALVTQGQMLDETVRNLQVATALHLEGEDLASLGVRENPTVLVMMELDPADANASSACLT
ncbi:MAG: type II toxin-antitoxin system HicB family antitoxin [Nitrospiraceae bacterium]